MNPLPQSSAAPEHARRLDLDWLRIIAFGILILYHVGLVYVTWDFHVKSPRASGAAEPLMLLVNPWRLDLLFLISGCATAFFLVPGKRLGAVVGQRSKRLLVPLLFGMFVIVPPQSYYQVVEQWGYQDGFGHFFLRYLQADHSFCHAQSCLILPTWNHLWFVAYLWVYTMLLAALAFFGPGLLLRFVAWFQARLEGWGLLVWPWLGLALVRMLLLSSFPSTHALADDWFNHATYGFAFILGYTLTGHAPSWEKMVSWRWQTLGLALVTFLAVRLYFSSYFDWVPESVFLRMAQRAVYAANQWTAILAALGWARYLLAGRADSPLRRYLTEGIFPFYIVHQTALIVIAHNIQPLALPLPIEVALVIAGTVASCLASFELVRRIGWMRPLFGLKPLGAAPPTGAKSASLLAR